MKSWKEEPCKFGTGEDGGVPELTESAMKQLGSQPSLPFPAQKSRRPQLGEWPVLFLGKIYASSKQSLSKKEARGRDGGFFFNRDVGNTREGMSEEFEHSG